MFEIGFVWLALAVVGAVIVWIVANRRGRNGPGWFLLAVIISPLIAGLLVLALPRSHDDVRVGEQPEPGKRPKGTGILFAGFMRLGAAVLVGCLVVVVMFVVALVLIIQHGGA